MRKKVAAYVLVFFVFIMTPFLITMAMTGIIEGSVSDSLVETRRVNVKYKNGTQAMDISKFMIGVIAKRFEISQEIEVLKAESIMIRTDIYRLMGDKMTIDSTELDMGYMTVSEMKAAWGDKYEDNYNLIVDCISATSGKLICCNGELIDARYTQLSSGKTRSGEEVDGTEYNYLASITCNDDILAQDYLCVSTFTNEDFTKAFKSAYKDSNLQADGISTAVQIVSRDSAEYVLKVQVGNVIMAGEDFADVLKLESSCFYIDISDNNTIKITTKGKGNGYGVSLYSADIMAKNESLNEEILKHFYSGISFMSE